MAADLDRSQAVTPQEASQERRDAAIKRGRRIDGLEAGQLANFIHRLAAIEPAVVDRVLAEFDANSPKPRTEKLLHPVTFYGNAGDDVAMGLGGIVAYCAVDVLWHAHLEDGHGLPELERLVREHSGITT